MSVYYHQPEVASLREGSEHLREQARVLRGEAAKLEEQARQLDSLADDQDAVADSVHRLCTAGSDPPATCCTKPPR